VRVHADKGAVAVEFALVLPILLVLLFGLIDFGLAYTAKSTLTHATREGVRVLALTRDPARVEPTVRAAAVGLVNPSANLDIDASTTCTRGEEATVTARYEYVYITPLAELLEMLPGTTTVGSSVDLEATGVMRCGG
jgi:Flp pilus assembly protein TadG